MRQPAGVDTRSGRAQSETIGIVLVFGLVILGASAVVVLGASAIGDSEERLSTQRAEKSLTQLDSKAALVALDNTDVQSVSFARREDGQFAVTGGTGWMNVTIQNTSDGTTTDLVNQSLGAVTYDNGGDRIAYQGGGVWRSSGNGSVMVSPPEFHFRNGTLTLPIINVTGGPSLNGGAALRHTETVEQYPLRPDRENPLDEHRIFVVVQSDYYAAWGSYFEERTDGNVKYDHAEKKAILELVSPLGKQTLNAASSSRAASGTFELNGAAKTASCAVHTVYSDSYNSTTKTRYCNQSPMEEGHIIYGEDVDISEGTGGSDFWGNLVSGGNVTVESGAGKPYVKGHINYTDSCNPSPSDCNNRISAADGDVNQINGIDTMHNINLLVNTTVVDHQGDNDNANVSDIDAATNTLDFSGGSATLPAGEYYAEDIQVNAGDKLILDTNGGTVRLAVEGGIKLDGSGGSLGDGGLIEVQGNGVAKIYVRGIDSVHARSEDVILDENSAVVTGGITGYENATQLRLYGRDDLTVALGGGSNLAKLVGVIFSPPGRSGTAEVNINAGEMYGGILTGTTTIKKGSIHYDEALRNTQVISRDSKVVRVTYLHVTVNQIEVSNR